MELSRGILKNFAKITDDSSKKTASTSVHATAVVADGQKYAKIDGSNVLTPIAETTDVQTGDRILVTVENHTAVVIGNFTYPPSARNEQKALEESTRASSTANSAIEKATEAQSLAADANTLSAQANTSASQAIASAQQASTLAQNAQAAASDANTKSDSAIASATSSLEQSAAAQKQLDALKAEVETVQGDVADARAEAIASVNAVKEEISVNYAKKTDVTTVEGFLKAEITKSVAELQSTISEQYTAKSDSVALEERLQSQITQNADSISSVVSRTTKLETDTSEAQKQIDAAKASAAEAQSTADAAQAAAKTAKDNADAAQSAAETAQANASAAQATADAARAKADAANTAASNAQTDLNNAKANLTEVTNRVGATEEEIAAAQKAVDDAQAAADQAIANAASANSAAATAQSAADKAKADAANAQSAAATAQTKADNASAAAATAQAAADKAQADADALKSRVTKCETSITQNAEAITLRATKTELTDQINTASQAIIDNLEDNYYTKTQTDSAIQVKADSILSTVSSTYQTKNAMANYSTTTQMNTAINQKADSIAQSVSATYATKSSLETANSNITSLTSRVQTAESKLTKDGLTTIVGDYYTATTYASFYGNGSRQLYCWLCQIKTNGAYINTPTVIEINQRGYGYSLCEIKFNSENSTDPSLYSIRKTGTPEWRIVKSATSTWDVYVKKSEAYDGITVTGFTKGAVPSVTWKCENADIPSGTTIATQLAGMYGVDSTSGGTSGSNSLITSGAVYSKTSAIETIATQTADKFNWLVKSGTSSTDFTLTDRTATLVANAINLQGLVTFDGLSSSAKNSIIDSVQVGGRNLIISKNAVFGYVNDNGNISYTNQYKATDYISVTPGDTLIFQFWSPTVARVWIDDTYFDSNKIYIKGYGGAWYENDTYYLLKFIVPSGASYIRVSYSWSEDFKYKLEKGNKATDWTPAPEDVDSSISAVDTALANLCYDSNKTYIDGGKIYTGTIAAAQIASKTITSDKLSVSTLSAITANLGTVTAGIIKSADYAYTSGNFTDAGMWIGLNSGNSGIWSKNFTIKSDGSLFLKGTITATSGNIGGFTIGSSALYNNTTALAGAANSVYVGTDGISCGTTFKVTKAGALTASSGTIGSMTITSSYLYKGSGSSQAGLGGKYAFWAGADQSATGVFPFSVTYDGVVTAKDLTLYQDESSTCAISIYDSMNNQVLSFAGADGNNVVILSDCWFNKSLNVAGGITTDGNIVPNTSDTYDLGSSSQPFSYLFTDGIRIGRTDYSAGAGFVNTRWKDGSAHNILYRSSDGLTSTVGWVGSSSYATILKLNGRTVQVQNSSGTSTLSDERLKKDIRKLDAWENFYLDLEPIAYKYKDGSSGRNHMGFLAQQVEKALLNNDLTSQDFGGLIKYDVNPDDEDSWHGYKTEYGLIYTEFTALNTYMTQKNVKAVKDLNHRFTVLDGKVNSTYARMASAEERIDKLEKENIQLKARIAQLESAA